MKPNYIIVTVCILLSLLTAGCTIKITKSTGSRNLDLYMKIVNESSKPIVYSTLWYFCTYHEWPKDKSDLEEFLTEGGSSIDLSKYTTIEIQKKQDGNVMCTYTIEGQKRKLYVDISFKDFMNDNFDCKSFPPHNKSADEIYHI